MEPVLDLIGEWESIFFFYPLDKYLTTKSDTYNRIVEENLSCPDAE